MELAQATGADIVALRVLGADGLAHFRGGWATTDILDGPQPTLRLRAPMTDRTPTLATDVDRMPIVPVGLDLNRWSGQTPARPQSLFCPVVHNGRVSSFVCLVASQEVVWSSDAIESIAIAAELMGQCHARLQAEGGLRHQVVLSDFLRATTQSFLTLVPGEEDQRIRQALGELGALLGAVSVAYWGAGTDNEPARRRFRWLAAGEELPTQGDPVWPITPEQRNHFRQMPEPLVIDPNIDGAELGLGTLNRRRDLTWLIVPGRLNGQNKVSLVLTRSGAQPWQEWEISGIAAFAELIPLVHARLATEAQLVASFHDAPVGITLRSNDGALLDCNQAFLDFLGLPSEAELLGAGGPELLASEELTDDMFHALANPPERGHRGLELPYRHSNGTVVWGRLSIAPLIGSYGNSWLTHVEDITSEREEAAVTLERATRDALTGLANRHELFDALDRELSRPKANQPNLAACAVLLLDLNGFKAVNDSLGHQAGDNLLVQVASRLNSNVRGGDLVGRYGGDEFVIIMTGPIAPRDADLKAAQLRAAFDLPFEIDDQGVLVGASIGVTLAAYGDSPHDVIASADRAMYREKSLARSVATSG